MGKNEGGTAHNSEVMASLAASMVNEPYLKNTMERKEL